MDSQGVFAAGSEAKVSTVDMKPSILVLGGTAEARELGERLAARTDLAATLSLAGRTRSPAAQAIPVRTGGFGGTEGLIRHLKEQGIRALIDATHPYAAVMSMHAMAAARETGIPLLALSRPPWEPLQGDRWIDANDANDAARLLGDSPQNVFLALGRQEVAPFRDAPHHRYLIRSIEPIDPADMPPSAHYLLERGPFDESAERALLEEHGIDVVVSKNSGGDATYGKIAAARSLAIAVVMVRRPPALDVPRVSSVEDALAWIDHVIAAPAERGV
jgi:precorrin-6A/cobalt-precorrin-6A reductase